MQKELYDVVVVGAGIDLPLLLRTSDFPNHCWLPATTFSRWGLTTYRYPERQTATKVMKQGLFSGLEADAYPRQLVNVLRCEQVWPSDISTCPPM